MGASNSVDPGESIRTPLGTGLLGSPPLGQPTSQTYDGPIPAEAIPDDGTGGGANSTAYGIVSQDATGSV